MFGKYSFVYGIFLLIAVPLVALCVGTRINPYTLLVMIVVAELILLALPILGVECQLKKQFSK
ncbi:hypothetical protein McpAg1_14080 [Methanocorpusculaceae archaeon Ag1]|uniref:Uncharacterized protein n=2 Tax=Methanorbis furvi TaxID=3028299 RepID=A0AAE4MDB4_9EURY|nr:hypothetical protein [Methanocorpusculaceae archaeon Ag1]